MFRLAAALVVAASAARRAPPPLPGATVRAGHRTRPLLPDNLRDYGNTPVWPLPAAAAPSGASPTLDPANFSFVFAPDAYLAEVTARFRPQILYHPRGAPSASRPALATVAIAVADASVRQVQQDTDESYSLAFALDGRSASIAAATVFGARHALETLSQLVDADRLTGEYVVDALNVTEAPRFPYRGLLVDAARHWLPPNILLTIMDGMAANKMNALQVGFGIDWSWTVESLAFPNLTEVTTYGPRGTHMYDRATVAWLVTEANFRGIRLVPYFEVVGHNALGEALKGIFWCNGVQGSGLPHPLHADTWAVCAALFADLKLLFPEAYMNVGGDEVDITCWQSDPEINAWMAAHNYPAGDWSFIEAHYYDGLTTALAGAGFKPIFFAEAFGAAREVDLASADVGSFPGFVTVRATESPPVCERRSYPSWGVGHPSK